MLLTRLDDGDGVFFLQVGRAAVVVVDGRSLLGTCVRQKSSWSMAMAEMENFGTGYFACLCLCTWRCACFKEDSPLCGAVACIGGRKAMHNV